MAEHPNVTLIRRTYEGLMQGYYVSALTETLSDDVVWHLPGSHPLAGDHRGRKAVLEAMAKFDGFVRIELHDVVGNDQHVVALLRARGSRKGKTYQAMEVDIFHVRDGRVTEFWSFSEDQRLTDEFWS